jgi:hypothetical protein
VNEMPGLEVAGLPADPGNITIPINSIPAIQTAIINAGVQAEIVFFIIGLILAFAFSYLYFRLWKKAKGIDV